MSARDEMVCVCSDGDTISTQEEEILGAKRAAPPSRCTEAKPDECANSSHGSPVEARPQIIDGPQGPSEAIAYPCDMAHTLTCTSIPNVLLDAILHRDADSEVVLKRVMAHGWKCTTSRFTFAEMLDTLQKEEKKGVQRP